MVMYDYLDEFRYLNWPSLCSGETSIQLKIVEPNNLLSLVLKLGYYLRIFDGPLMLQENLTVVGKIHPPKKKKNCIKPGSH